MVSLFLVSMERQAFQNLRSSRDEVVVCDEMVTMKCPDSSSGTAYREHHHTLCTAKAASRL